MNVTYVRRHSHGLVIWINICWYTRVINHMNVTYARRHSHGLVILIYICWYTLVITMSDKPHECNIQESFWLIIWNRICKKAFTIFFLFHDILLRTLGYKKYQGIRSFYIIHYTKKCRNDIKSQYYLKVTHTAAATEGSRGNSALNYI